MERLKLHNQLLLFSGFSHKILYTQFFKILPRRAYPQTPYKPFSFLEQSTLLVILSHNPKISLHLHSKAECFAPPSLLSPENVTTHPVIRISSKNPWSYLYNKDSFALIYYLNTQNVDIIIIRALTNGP